MEQWDVYNQIHLFTLSDKEDATQNACLKSHSAICVLNQQGMLEFGFKVIKNKKSQTYCCHKKMMLESFINYDGQILSWI